MCTIIEGSIQAAAFSGLGNFSKAAGKVISKVPVISKSPVDEALMNMGSKLKGIGSRPGKDAMIDFRNNRDAGIHLFLENIEVINKISNQPVEVLFDKEQVFICG